MLRTLRSLPLRLALAVTLGLAASAAAAIEKTAPFVGPMEYRALRLGESGLSWQWRYDEASAIYWGLQDYLHTGLYCSHTLVGDPGWVQPVFFGNSGIEISNYKRQMYHFVHGSSCATQFDDSLSVERKRLVECPRNWSWSGTEFACVQFNPLDPDKNNDECPLANNGSNPVHSALGTKLQREIDIAVPGSELKFERYYSSTVRWRAGTLGKQWRHNFDRRIDHAVTSGRETAFVSRPNGNVLKFGLLPDGRFASDADVRERLVPTRNGQGAITGWLLTNADDSQEHYDAEGLLVAISWSDGRRLALSYAGGLLRSVADERGRSLVIQYYERQPVGGPGGLIQSVTAPDGAQTHFSYQAAGTEKVISQRMHDARGRRSYIYGEAGAAPRLLTGIVDENGNRYASWRYDAQSRAVLSVHGDATSHVDRVEFTYSGDAATSPNTATTKVKEWMNGSAGKFTERTYSFTLKHGVIKLAGVTQPCASCGGKLQSVTYDVNGFEDTLTDFNGVVTDLGFTAVDASGQPRGLETLRVEAAAKGVQTNLPQRRSHTTLWHPTFNKPVERRLTASSGEIESAEQWAYNARGQVTAHCRYDAAQTAFSAYVCSPTSAPDPGLNIRRNVYTYCESADVANPAAHCPVVGYLKQVDGPRDATDDGMNRLEDIVRHLYRTADDPGCNLESSCTYRKGDLWKKIDALGHVTEYVEYHLDGRVKRVKDANGTYTDFTYGADGWLQQRRVYAKGTPVTEASDAVTLYEYLPTGEVSRVVEPDGAFLEYSYDNARRLVGISDALGNRVIYTLDSSGHRVKEETFDASYSPSVPGQGLKRSIGRVYNDLGRLTAILNAAQLPTRDSGSFDSGGLADGYDGNGNAVLAADGLGVVKRQNFDPLNRLAEVLSDYLGANPDTHDASMSYTFDARNNVRSVTDPDGLTTTYTYDGLGNLVALDSPDTGHAQYTYDRAGNRISATDNRGVTTNYVYDALNRTTRIVYPEQAENAVFSYDLDSVSTGCSTNFSIGQVSRVVDSSGSTVYCHDRRGNVLRKIQTTGGVVLDVSYTYTRADKIASIVYPDGEASYGRDALGRISSLSWQPTPNSLRTSVVSAIGYLPFGPLNSLTFGNGRSLAKHYDADYVIDRVVSSASGGLVLDFTTDVMSNIVAASDTVGASTPTRKYIYDPLYRITRVDTGSNAMAEDYAYTRTGDRTLKQFAGQAAEVYSYLAGTHRLDSVAGAARSYDENGNTTNLGGALALSYDLRNRYTELTSGNSMPGELIEPDVRYFYNSLGERVAKQVPGPLRTTFLYDESGRLLHETSPAGRSSYLYVDDMPVALWRAGALNYIETDHLNTPRVAAHSTSNAAQWRWNFFGSAFGENAAAGEGGTPVDVPLRYAGQYFDAESGLHYNRARDYEPATGRYIESDPLGLHGDWSTYAYVDGDPLSATDPEGLKAVSPKKLCNAFPVDGVKCDGTCNCQNKYSRAACLCHAKSMSLNPLAFVKRYLCIERAREDARMCIWNCSGTCPCDR